MLEDRVKADNVILAGTDALVKQIDDTKAKVTALTTPTAEDEQAVYTGDFSDFTVAYATYEFEVTKGSKAIVDAVLALKDYTDEEEKKKLEKAAADLEAAEAAAKAKAEAAAAAADEGGSLAWLYVTLGIVITCIAGYLIYAYWCKKQEDGDKKD